MKTSLFKLIVAASCIFFNHVSLAQVRTIADEELSDSLSVVSSSIQPLAEGGSSSIEAPFVIPSSPQIRLFEKYINHQISEYNGLPDITIPLYEIELDGLKIPIALTYHASGIQYMQHDGEVGVGWSINAAGYRISRSVKGTSDFYSTFYNEDIFQSYVSESDKTNINRYLDALSRRSGNSSTMED